MTSKTQKKKSKKRDKSRSPGKAKSNGQSNGKSNSQAILGFSVDNRPDWEEFVEHLRTRRKPPSVFDLFGQNSKSPWLWSLTVDVQQSDSMAIVDQLYSITRGRLKPSTELLAQLHLVLESAEESDANAAAALVYIASAAVLPELTSVTSESEWWSLYERLSSKCKVPSDADHWTKQLQSVELPLTLLYSLPEIELSLPSLADILETWSVIIDRLLDGDGWIKAGHIDEFRPCLASWARCNLLLKSLNDRTLGEDHRLMMEWALRQVFRLSRRDGTQMLTDDASGSWNRAMFEAALSLSDDRDDQRIAHLMLPGFKVTNKSKRSLMVEESSFSEWAGLGVMQCGWSTKSPKVAVACDKKDLKFELYRSTTLLKGMRLPEVSVNGRVLEPTSDWSLNCWHSDEDADFLEVEIDLEKGYRLQRQFILGREDEFLILADVILGKKSNRIDYRLELEATDPVTWLPESETTEVYLTTSKIRSLVMPLGISEWRSNNTENCLHVADNRMELFQSQVGQNMYCGLFFDLKPRRSKAPRTWRSLTVAEHLEIVKPDIAVAFRVQVGREQWVIYRSLDERGNRSFLGQNHSCEFFIGRFDPEDGDAEQLLMIE